MKKPRRTRREFLREASVLLASATTAPLLLGCSQVTATEELGEAASRAAVEASLRTSRTRREPDITLTADVERLAETIRSQYTKLKTIAHDASTQLRIAFPMNDGQDILSLSIVPNGAANYRHVRIVRESNGDVANLLWGREGLYPSIRFTDDQGRTIVRNGRPLEFSFRSVQREGRGPVSWLELGIKIAAIGLLVWLGASILKPIVAALAFIAFNAMVIGIAIAGVVLVVGILRWILDVTGWTLKDVRQMFERTVEEFVGLLRLLVGVLEQG